jgi:hypothetical protein
MSLTVDSVQQEVEAARADGKAGGPLTVSALAQCLSHGSLMGARGNSGVILSQVLRGMSGALAAGAGDRTDAGSGGGASSAPAAEGGPGGAPGTVGPGVLAEALERASQSAYAAVSNPVEGTILTVARAAAEGAHAAVESPGASVLEVMEEARRRAATALAETTEILPALKAAGVVDAGGAGLLLLFDSFLAVLAGRKIEPPPMPASMRHLPRATAEQVGQTAAKGQSAVLGADDIAQGPRRPPEDASAADLRYEVMFFLEAPDESVPAFRSVWASCGGSVVIVGGDGLYNCHIHTDDVGASIEAAIEIGRPRQIRVTDLQEQVQEERWVREAAASGEQEEPPAEPCTCAVVAVCAGEGVRRIFKSLGARQTVWGGQTANPSTAEILEAVAAAPAEQVVVLPNNPNVVAVAEQAAAHSPKKVRVVPTAGIVEGFAALLDYDPEADVDTNVDQMTAAAARIVAGEVAQASRGAMTEIGPVQEGDWLGMSRQGIKTVATSAADAAIALLALLVAEDHEIVTIIEGEGAHAGDTRRVVEWLNQERPSVSSEVHHGGQPLYPYLFSIE